MRLYTHITDGGAEYYCTQYVETPSGEKVGTLESAVIRTDGNELKILDYAKLRQAGFTSFRLPKQDEPIHLYDTSTIVDVNRFSGVHIFERVEEFPPGYSVWNIGRQNFPYEKCVPLCKPGVNMEYWQRNINPNSLKYIEVESEKLALLIMKEAEKGERNNNREYINNLIKNYHNESKGTKTIATASGDIRCNDAKADDTARAGAIDKRDATGG